MTEAKPYSGAVPLESFEQEIPEGFSTASALPKLPLATRLKSIRRRRTMHEQEMASREAIAEAVRNGEIKRSEYGWHLLREINPQLHDYMIRKNASRGVDKEKMKLDRRG